MNKEKLNKLMKDVRIGGKGTPRRKRKIVHQTPGTDDKKLQSVLKKTAVNPIPGIEEVNMIKNDGTVIHFNNPKAQASLAANTFAITGHGELKQVSLPGLYTLNSIGKRIRLIKFVICCYELQITDMLPGILTQLGPEGFAHLKRLASGVSSSKLAAEDDEVPELIGNFEDTANNDIVDNLAAPIANAVPAN